MSPALAASREPLQAPLLAELTATQQEAVTHDHGPLLVLAGAGTGKTTVIARRIAWLLATERAAPDEILALTFTDKAAAEMEERVDLLVPYGCTDTWISTFHAFGDRVLREHAVAAGLSAHTRVLAKAEQLAFLQEHLFDLPLDRFRPPPQPTRYVEALATVMSRAKDEAVSPAQFLAYAQAIIRDAKASSEDPDRQRQIGVVHELARCYEAYQHLLHEANAMDFGDQVLLAIQLFEQHPDILARHQRRFRYILVDEFQDTNFAQFRLLQLLAPPAANITVVADDDQSIYKWRGAALSNVLKFLEHYHDVRRVVLTQNFRSTQPILDCAYRLIRFNDPDRLEVRESIDKRLVSMRSPEGQAPMVAVFDTASSEADWVARQIQAGLESSRRQPGDFAILVRTNRDAELFLRALNVCGIPWHFSGTTGLLTREDSKVLLSCLRTLADPEDSLSWYHVISSSLYACPMADLVACLASANRGRRSLRAVCEELGAGTPQAPAVSEAGRACIERFLSDVRRLVELSRTLSPGQLLYRWLTDTGWLKHRAALDRQEDVEQLQVVAQFFDRLHRFETLVGNRLPELMQALEFFQALEEPPEDPAPAPMREAVQVLTIHKAKGLEFPVVFLVGLAQRKFPTPSRRDPIELPEALIQDILPSGNYHLQEERRLCYVGMTRAREAVYLTAASRYGGRTAHKLSQFVQEALEVSAESVAAEAPSAVDRIQRAKPPQPAARGDAVGLPEPLRLDPHGLDDYLTCPLKFRYSHVLRIPVMRHHLVIYGAALHKAVEAYFKRHLADQPMSETELIATFEAAWSSEGFLSREHETQRLQQGRQILARFAAQQRRQPEHPTLIEEKFSFHVEDIVVVGRWDRVDGQADEAVIIDYKSSDIAEQAEADRRVRSSLQMAVYALAWQTISHHLPKRLELRFLETSVTGSMKPTDAQLEKTRRQLLSAAQDIRAKDFHPEPQEFSCRWCAYQTICPFSAV